MPQSQTSICQTERMYVLQKTLQQQVGFLMRALPSSASLSSGCKQHWANAESCSHFLYNDTITLGTRAGICSAWRSPSSLTDCCQCAHNSPLPELSWCRVCLPSLPTPLLITDDHCGVGILLPFLTLCPPFPGLRSLVSMHSKYWVVAYSAEMCFRSRVWEEEAQWLCMFDTSLRSGLLQLWKGHVSKEVRHGMFVTWEEVSGSWGLYKVMVPEQLLFLSQPCEISFGFDTLLPALMNSADYSWKKNLESMSDCSLLDHLL